MNALPSPVHDVTPTRDLFEARVEVNRRMCRDHYLLRLRITGPRDFPTTQPGQFIQLGCANPDRASRDTREEVTWQPGEVPALHQDELCHPSAFLRRPFSLSGRGDDVLGTWVEVIHRVVGVGTDWLSKLRVGDAVDFVGPLGNTFTRTPGKNNALLVGGGVGLPPMFYLAEALDAAGWKAMAFVGATTSELLAVSIEEGLVPESDGRPNRSIVQFASYSDPSVVTSDDGTIGMKGRVTDGLLPVIEKMSGAERSKTVIYTCGPEPMMHAVTKLAERFGIECQVCLEQAMACGMGTCQSCIVKIEPDTARGEVAQGRSVEGRDWRYKLACTDGPVFDSRRVVWG
ncbi:MAG: hypothetical protein GC164_07225 [Phycisphaera sp.]|nr:hypothetical protein [Phycisphaera sp.]